MLKNNERKTILDWILSQQTVVVILIFMMGGMAYLIIRSFDQNQRAFESLERSLSYRDSMLIKCYEDRNMDFKALLDKK